MYIRVIIKVMLGLSCVFTNLHDVTDVVLFEINTTRSAYSPLLRQISEYMILGEDRLPSRMINCNVF